VADDETVGERHAVRSAPEAIDDRLAYLREQGLDPRVKRDAREDGRRVVTFVKETRSTADGPRDTSTDGSSASDRRRGGVAADGRRSRRRPVAARADRSVELLPLTSALRTPSDLPDLVGVGPGFERLLAVVAD
jgi:hypothetical protein